MSKHVLRLTTRALKPACFCPCTCVLARRTLKQQQSAQEGSSRGSKKVVMRREKDSDVSTTRKKKTGGFPALDAAPEFVLRPPLWRTKDKGRAREEPAALPGVLSHPSDADRSQTLLPDFDADRHISSWSRAFKTISFRTYHSETELREFEQFLDNFPVDVASEGYQTAIYWMLRAMHFNAANYDLRRRLCLRIERLFPAAHITKRTARIATLLASVRGVQATSDSTRIEHVTRLMERLDVVAAASPWDAKSTQGADHNSKLALPNQLEQAEASYKEALDTAAAYINKVLKIDPSALQDPDVRLLLGGGLFAAAGFASDLRPFDVYRELNASVEQYGMTEQMIQSWAYAINRAKSTEQAIILYATLRTVTPRTPFLSPAQAQASYKERRLPQSNKFRKRIRDMEEGSGDYVSVAMTLPAGDRELARSWALCHATLLEAGDLQAAAEVLAAAKEMLAPPLFAVVIDYWIRSLSYNPSLRQGQDLRQILRELIEENSSSSMAYAYMHAIAGLAKTEATPQAAVEIYEDMVELARQGAFKVRLAELAECLDRLNSAAHRAEILEESKPWARKALQLFDDFAELRKEGVVADDVAPEMPHGITNRIVATLSRVGMTSAALRVAHQWMSSHPKFQYVYEKKLRLVMPWVGWIGFMGNHALGGLHGDLPPPRARHLAIHSSFLLRIGLLTTPWLHRQITNVFSDAKALSTLSPTELAALAKVHASGQFRGDNYVDYKSLKSKLTRPEDVEEDAAEEAKMQVVEWREPVILNHRRRGPSAEDVRIIRSL